MIRNDGCRHATTTILSRGKIIIHSVVQAVRALFIFFILLIMRFLLFLLLKYYAYVNLLLKYYYYKYILYQNPYFKTKQNIQDI